MAVLLVACNGSSPRGGESNGYNSTVNVIVKDFSISLDPPQTEAGTITLVVANDGSVQHDFAIRSNGMEQKTPMIEAGETASLTVDLEPGTYTYICTIPGHEQLGMIGTFTVTSN
jgi:uncharacterized cupredoxin-like copper-binding protein